MKKNALIAVLSILCLFQIYHLIVYRALTPRLIWTIETLWLDWKAEKSLYDACQKRRPSNDA